MTANELQAWRTKQGLSQESLAALLGVNVMTISRWERGLRALPPYLPLVLEALEARSD